MASTCRHWSGTSRTSRSRLRQRAEKQRHAMVIGTAPRPTGPASAEVLVLLSFWCWLCSCCFVSLPPYLQTHDVSALVDKAGGFKFHPPPARARRTRRRHLGVMLNLPFDRISLGVTSIKWLSGQSNGSGAYVAREKRSQTPAVRRVRVASTRKQAKEPTEGKQHRRLWSCCSVLYCGLYRSVPAT